MFWLAFPRWRSGNVDQHLFLSVRGYAKQTLPQVRTAALRAPFTERPSLWRDQNAVSIRHPLGDANTLGRRLGLSRSANSKLISLRNSIPRRYHELSLGKRSSRRQCSSALGQFGGRPVGHWLLRDQNGSQWVIRSHTSFVSILRNILCVVSRWFSAPGAPRA